MIKTSIAEYTGGGIYIYYGQLKDGKWYLTDDDCLGEYVAIVDINPENFDESLMPEWQESHKVAEITGDKARLFCAEMIKKVSDGNFDRHEMEDRLNRL